MDERIFKAYDVRGRYPDELNEEAAEEVARAVRRMFQDGAFVVARDARLSSPALYRAVLRGVGRGRVIAAGAATTPLFYFLVNRLRAAGGIMVTGSHTPKEYNGLKVVGRGAVPVSGKEVLRWVQRRDVRNKSGSR